MKKRIFIYTVFLFFLIQKNYSQNVGINTTGASPAATNLFEVLQTSTTASSVGIYSAHSGAITGTGYGIWAQKTGASTTNVAGYFSASGATSNYAIIVPASGGSVGIGTSTPESLLEVQGTEANDATITLDADDGDDATDTWHIKSTATGNYLNFTNDATEYFRMTGPKLYVMNSGQSVFMGENAGAVDDLSTNRNVFVGYNAGALNTTGENNVFVGHGSGPANTTGYRNVGVGYRALEDQEDGIYNVAVGSLAMVSCIDCNSNTAVGYNSLGVIEGGAGSTAIGNNCLELARGELNTAVGAGALKNLAGTIGVNAERNIALGVEAGVNLNTGSHNIIIGYHIEAQDASTDNQLNIGNIIYGTDIDGDLSVVSTGNIGIGVPEPSSRLHVSSNARLGVASTTSGTLIFNNATNVNTATISAGTPTASYTLTLPADDGSANQALVTDGSGNLSWSSSTASGSAMFVQTADQSFSNTTATSSFFGTGAGTLTIPANTLTAGSHIRIKILGYGSRNSGTLTIAVNLGATNIITSGGGTWAAALNDVFDLEIDLTCRTAGALGTFIGQGYFRNYNGSIALLNVATTAVNTTGALTVGVTGSFSIANAGNTITSTNATVEILD